MVTQAVEAPWDSALEPDEYNAVAQLRNELNRPFNPDDVMYGEFRGDLAEIAEKYVRTYRGTFEFIQDVAIAYRRNNYLTAGQAKGVLNTICAEIRRRPKPEEPENALGLTETFDPNRWIIPDGRYTVVRPNGDYHTLRLKTLDEEKQARYKKPAGTRIISYLNGPDNSSDYMMFGWVTPGGKLQIKKGFNPTTRLVEDAENLLTMTRDGVLQTTEAYALKSNSCSICGRDLTREDSILYGMGPICRRKFGL